MSGDTQRDSQYLKQATAIDIFVHRKRPGRLADFVAHYNGWTEAAFCDRFPQPFLIYYNAVDTQVDDFATRQNRLTPTALKENPVIYLAKREHELVTKLTLGRKPENDISVQWAKVSSRHAMFLIEDDEVSVMDCQSTNGTFINRRQLEAKEAYTLEGSAINISFSKSLAFLYVKSRSLYRQIQYLVD